VCVRYYVVTLHTGIFHVKDRRPCWMAFSHRSLKNDPRMKIIRSLSCVSTFERTNIYRSMKVQRSLLLRAYVITFVLTNIDQSILGVQTQHDKLLVWNGNSFLSQENMYSVRLVMCMQIGDQLIIERATKTVLIVILMCHSLPNNQPFVMQR
jgi:hypothetical protein